MPYFVLSPRNLNAPEWQLSTRLTPVQVEAVDVESARYRAAKLYAAYGGPSGLSNPWIRRDLTEATLLADVDPTLPVVRVRRSGDKVVEIQSPSG